MRNIITLITFFIFPFIAQAQFSGGNGTASAPYLITTAAQLAQLATYVNEGNATYNASYYKLENNLDLSGYQSGSGWTPIGNSTNPFKGDFNGDGHIITGLYINLNTTSSVVGLFGYVFSGANTFNSTHIQNLGVEGVNISSTQSDGVNIGALVGSIRYGDISCCYTTGTVIGKQFPLSGSYGSPRVSGLVGSSTNTYISNCYTMVNVTSEGWSSSSSGVVGSLDDSFLTNCYATGDLTTVANSYQGRIAGIVSYATLSNHGELSNCVALNNYLTINNGSMGRIATYLTGTVSNNAAYDYMNGHNYWEPVGGNTINGLDMTITEIRTDGTLGGRFNPPVWTVENGKLPGLFGHTVDLPEHLALLSPVIITTTLHDGGIGIPYTYYLYATGSTPITWSLDNGNLPTGLELSSNGVISGIPSATGTFNFTVKATNSEGSGTKALSLVIKNTLDPPIYHDDDKEGLRMFLRQPSFVEGKINGERLGLEISDTLNWHIEEAWVSKVINITWNTQAPKRIDYIGWSTSTNIPGNAWEGKSLAGNLDARKWSAIRQIHCYNNRLNSVNVNGLSNLLFLNVWMNNELNSIDVTGCGNMQILYCYNTNIASINLSDCSSLGAIQIQSNQLTHLDLSAAPGLVDLRCNENLITGLDHLILHPATTLSYIQCSQNYMKLTDLCVLSQRTNNPPGIDNMLGYQFMLKQIVTIGKELDYSDQISVCGGTTTFKVEMGYPQSFGGWYWTDAPAANYTITNGKIKFNQHLSPPYVSYLLWLTNDAIPSYPQVAAMYGRIDIVETDNYLSNLTVTPGVLTPAFDIETQNYTVNVSNSVSQVTITGTANDPQATVTGNGLKPIVVGENVFTITVTAVDGVSTRIYTVTVNRAVPGNDATLTNLTVSPGTLTPSFNSNIYNYTVNVAYTVTSITITGTANDPQATVTGNGLKPIVVGANAFTITVTAENGVTTQNYIVTVNRAAPSNDATLSNITVSQGALTPVFNSNTYNYTVNVSNSITSITISATTSDPNATISGNGVGTHTLVLGANVFTITVTAQDGVTTQNYVVTVNRLANSVATLSNITVSPGTLTPAFNSNTYNYTVDLAYTVTSITISATTTDPNATISGNGVGTHSLTVGANLFTITVTAQDGVTTQNYTITVNRAAPSTDATLMSLTVSPGTLTPAFNSNTYNYTVDLAYTVTEISISATTSDPNATISGNGIGTHSLTVGANLFTITVTAQDGVTTQNYVVTVNRAAPSTDATLMSLTVSPGTLTPVFNSNTYNYTVDVAFTVTEISISATTSDPNATISGNGIGTHSLTVGANLFTITV
ncbi:MAG: cadherin-like beta sandwich domain-containing protein, partial [Lentimicrobiaceae bacterium]|nr:cadherin-like beta sandwich domain-containing protein [Lentimicrobiaceae bacterium]